MSLDAAPGGGPAHAPVDPASAWVRRFAANIPVGGAVLDLAAGHGRHARFLKHAGLRVTAVDRDPAALAALRELPAIEVLAADIETGPWPLGGRVFDAVVVTNYLWRPVLPMIAAALASGGVLIYETFAVGNEIHGKPSNPKFLLSPGELLDFARQSGLCVVAYECGYVVRSRPAVVQRICALRQVDGAAPGNLNGAD